MRDQGEDYKSYVFVKTNTPISTLITAEGVKETFSLHEYAPVMLWLFLIQVRKTSNVESLMLIDTRV